MYRRYLKDKICEHCGEIYRPRRDSQKTCSATCRAKARKHPHGSMDQHGYMVLSVDGKQIPEHRLVMERILGRKLEPFETVHHKDGLRANNDPLNLELWTKNHGAGVRVDDLLKLYWPLIEQKINSNGRCSQCSALVTKCREFETP